MRIFYALVDYYNHVPDHLGRRLDYAGHRTVLDLILAKLLEARDKIGIVADELRVRLYGGWFDGDGEPTDARMQLSSLLRDVPRRSGKRLRISTQIADGLVLPTDTLTATYRERPGLVPFSVVVPSCRVPACSVVDLDSWRRGRCPQHEQCGVATRSVTRSLGQKLVDSMIVSDQVLLSHQPGDQWVATVSNDDDVIPGVLAARSASSRVALIRIGRRQSSPYDRILEGARIQICDLGA